MSLKQLLIIISLATLICWLVWIFVLFQVDPNITDWPNLLIFYASLFVALIGSFFLISFVWRRMFTKYILEYRLVGVSFRQSFFFSLLVVGVLFLAAHNFLTWWNIILLVLGVGIVEYLCLSVRRVA